MSSRLKDLPRSAWEQIFLWTAITISLCVVASVGISIVLLNVISQGINGPGMVTAIVMPIIMGTPIMFYMQLRHQQLKLANRKLDILASTDWLTDTLNRRAFTDGASALLAPGANHQGTLLVVDADHFKAVNDQFGHEAGDEALQLLAKTIQASVRTTISSAVWAAKSSAFSCSTPTTTPPWPQPSGSARQLQPSPLLPPERRISSRSALAAQQHVIGTASPSSFGSLTSSSTVPSPPAGTASNSCACRRRSMLPPIPITLCGSIKLPRRHYRAFQPFSVSVAVERRQLKDSQHR